MHLVDIIYLFAFFVMIYCVVLWLIVLFINSDKFKKVKPLKKWPSVTFLVPAYNEEKHIAKCIESLLKLDYPIKPKIIVINDGSTDKTEEIAKKYEKYGVKVITKPNEGKKAKALNYALKNLEIDTDLVICMDADSYPEKNFLKKIIPYIQNAHAVTPAMKVANPKTIWEKIQWVEYCFSILLRKLFAIFDCQYVLPGPGSVYRTDVLKKLGYFDEENLTEDMEMAFRMINQGYRIENAIDAYVYTDCPKTFRELFKQRIRWYRGYLQNVKKYSHMLFNPIYGNLGVFLLPVNFLWIFIVVFFFVYPIYNFILNAFDTIYKIFHAGFLFTFPEFKINILYVDFFTFFWIFIMIISFINIALSIKYSGEKLELWKKKTFYISFFLLYPFIIGLFYLVSIIYELLGVKGKW